MTPVVIGNAELWLGDCLDVMRGIAENSVDSIVTDPPYGLSFMGKKWDYDVPCVDVWAECLRVLRPGGHLLAFAGTRTQHRMAVRIEDAGFEIRDMIAWVYGSGFPKHRSSLKPALEPITLARKPAPRATLLNIDACRVASTDSQLAEKYASVRKAGSRRNSVYGTDDRDRAGAAPHDAGRYPANLIHDGSDEVVALFPNSAGAGGSVPNVKITGYGAGIGAGKSEYFGGDRQVFDSGSGSAARFFYCAKASKADRDEGLEDFKKRSGGMISNTSGQHITRRDEGYEVAPRANNHPTVKPTGLMRYLCRLVTPSGGVVLDPFMGSGSTGKAAVLEGFQFIGIEREAEYLAIAEARIKHAQRQTSLFEPAPNAEQQSLLGVA